MHYFVKIDYQPELGLGAEELVRRIKEERIPATALIRRADSSEWKSLESYPELVYTTPPPLPNHAPQLEAEPPVKSSNPGGFNIPSYFRPQGRIGRIVWVMRNTINFIAIGAISVAFNILPEFLHILFFIPLLIYFYIVLITSSKRLHDLNVTGWMSPLVFIPLVPLFLLILSGTKGSNKFGDRTENLFE